jgi:hypothetical protein
MSIPDSPEINPGVHFLFDLLKWVRKGRVRVPGFQRNFVWRRDQMLDLFDSVRRHYPIGTLLLWRSAKYGPRAPAVFGPFALEVEPPPEGVLLVLDGQQRLTTLAGALLFGGAAPMKRRDEVDPDPRRWEVYFDAAEDLFTHIASSEKASPWQVPVWALVDTGLMFERVAAMVAPATEEARALLENMPVGTYVARLQAVGRALQTYKVPVVEFSTDDLRVAVDGFARVNMKGQSIGPDEMFAAFAWRKGEPEDDGPNQLQVSAAIDEVIADVRNTGFGELDRLVVLRAFMLLLGADPYRTDWETLANDDAQMAKLPATMAETRAGLLAAVDFVRSEGIHTLRLLPYGLQLVGLAAWFAADPDPGPEARRLLRRWLWLTGAASWFGQGNPARYTKVLVELRQAAKEVRAGKAVPTELSSLPWSTRTEPFPARYDLRAARVRSLLCVLFRDGVRGLDGRVLNSEAVHAQFAKRGPETMRTIWTRCPGTLGSSPANRIFDLWPSDRGQARRMVEALPVEVRAELSAAHHFDAALGADLPIDWEPLLRARLDRMAAVERDFLGGLGLRPPEGVGDAPFDADGEAPLEGASSSGDDEATA